MMRYVVGSILHGADPLSYFSDLEKKENIVIEVIVWVCAIRLLSIMELRFLFEDIHESECIHLCDKGKGHGINVSISN